MKNNSLSGSLLKRKYCFPLLKAVICICIVLLLNNAGLHPEKLFFVEAKEGWHAESSGESRSVVLEEVEYLKDGYMLKFTRDEDYIKQRYSELNLSLQYGLKEV
ncbi:MAG: hypothetical protein QW728_05920, partial [Thermoplasmata archaeon]